MKGRAIRVAACAAAVVFVGAGVLVIGGDRDRAPRRMAFHNRLLLNRAAVSKLEALEVMLLVHPDALTRASRLVDRLGGTVARTQPIVGYMRVEVPTDRLLDLVGSTDIDAYQISSFSRGAWYRDGPPQSNAEMNRGLEVRAPGTAAASDSHPELPVLSEHTSRLAGYTANEDAGVGEWLKNHPTFDGRGVTIALLESGQAAFANAIFGSAKALDGHDVPKLAGIVNTIPEDKQDETRVCLNTEIQTATNWVTIGGRTYILPRPGRYHFGVFTLPAGANLIHQFPVLEDSSHGIRIDTNGNASFKDETPIADINERFDIRSLKLIHPQQMDLSVVMARNHTPHTIHLYCGLASHQTMTVSVAAGSRTKGSLAYGVAPGARVLLIRTHSRQYRLRDLLEGYIDAVTQAKADVFSDSMGLTLVPDTAADFAGLLFRRIADAYGKPIFHGAGNTRLFLNSVFALGGFTVGGSLGPRTFAALFGGGVLAGLTVHPTSAAGPALDGRIKPDFLAPMHRIAADVPWNGGGVLPRNTPTRRLPAGYQISCCTSASSPYAAGVAALLISAARQRHADYSLATLGRAMRVGARFLADVPSYQQGNGVLDVGAAWRELTHPVQIPRILATADIVHPLAKYAARGPRGSGILEFEGWTSGMTARRQIELLRQSGTSGPVAYRVDWTGNDGTFAAPDWVTLPLNTIVALPVTIGVTSDGAHGALLNLHDPATDAIVFRTQATIVAASRVDPATGVIRCSGTVPLMRADACYVQVPAGVGALSIELEVKRGAVRAAILPSHGLLPAYYQHLYPGLGRSFVKGHYSVVLPDPTAGTWTISLSNNTARNERDPRRVSTDTAEYAVTVRPLTASVELRRARNGFLGIQLENLGSALGAPAVQTSIGTLISHPGSFLQAGLPNTFDIHVPAGTSTLALRLRSTEHSKTAVELYLYDCTSGECFSYNFTLPAAREQRMVVRRPTPGRWIAAVNAAPFPTAEGGFVLDQIQTGELRVSSAPSQSRAPGARWTAEVEVGTPPMSTLGDAAPILFVELLDRATEREEAERPWDPRPTVPKLRDRPVAIGTAVYRLQ